MAVLCGSLVALARSANGCLITTPSPSRINFVDHIAPLPSHHVAYAIVAGIDAERRELHLLLPRSLDPALLATVDLVVKSPHLDVPVSLVIDEELDTHAKLLNQPYVDLNPPVDGQIGAFARRFRGNLLRGARQ